MGRRPKKAGAAFVEASTCDMLGCAVGRNNGWTTGCYWNLETSDDTLEAIIGRPLITFSSCGENRREDE